VARQTGGLSAATLYDFVLREIAQRDIRGRILEAGAGLGLLTPKLTRADRTLTCVDLLPRPTELPEDIAWLQADLNEPLPLPAASFDAIICTEVIGYLENPHALFREFHRLLRNGGALLLTMPNQESLRSYACLVIDGHFTAFRRDDHPGYITPLLRLDFERLCANSGFSPPEFRYTDSGSLPKFPRLTWQRLFFGLPRGRLFSDNVLVHARKAA
jgi:SAM-dependent methyltransferase